MEINGHILKLTELKKGDEEDSFEISEKQYSAFKPEEVMTSWELMVNTVTYYEELVEEMKDIIKDLEQDNYRKLCN